MPHIEPVEEEDEDRDDNGVDDEDGNGSEDRDDNGRDEEVEDNSDELGLCMWLLPYVFNEPAMSDLESNEFLSSDFSPTELSISLTKEPGFHSAEIVVVHIDTKVKQDGDERRSFTMPVASLEVPSPEESENVWSLIPQLKRKLHMHQKKAFEFLWRNLAGSRQTFLIIPFLASYLKIFRGKRPLVLAPKTTLYTWYKKFIKWEIPVPVHLIHDRRTKRTRFSSRGFQNRAKTLVNCLDKIQKWHAQPV
ncbi:hypothetical protein HID58_029409 [Brassica napus]|uniref:Uncharacterized protein n=3 Tax=Brassica TaxID=3705 RepID=A0ABQ8CEP9_BRANA|nr:hypothetical protein HID58_029409 [Brassica napus]